jgi:hypothetical protein
MICDPRFHGGRHAQGLVNPASEAFLARAARSSGVTPGSGLFASRVLPTSWVEDLIGRAAGLTRFEGLQSIAGA